MSEPTNPLFEQEKAFLERKKLEYERALRGDVEQLKEKTADVGRIALVSGGLAGSIWLITKMFTSRKKRPKARYSPEYEPADYRSQPFADFGFGEEGDEHRATAGRWPDTDPYFASSPDDSHQGAVYHTDSESYNDPTAGDSDEGLDDNDLHDYPDFPAHSTSSHGPDAAAEAENFGSEAYGHPDSTLPFDDSRHLPESTDFAADDSPLSPRKPTASPLSPSKPAEPGDNLGSMLLGLAKSSVGKVVLGQAASFAIALATKAIKSKLMSDAPETAKSSDLADLTGENDGYAHGHPATPQPDAYPALDDASAHSEPLA